MSNSTCPWITPELNECRPTFAIVMHYTPIIRNKIDRHCHTAVQVQIHYIAAERVLPNPSCQYREPVWRNLDFGAPDEWCYKFCICLTQLKGMYYSSDSKTIESMIVPDTSLTLLTEGECYHQDRNENSCLAVLESETTGSCQYRFLQVRRIAGSVQLKPRGKTEGDKSSRQTVKSQLSRTRDGMEPPPKWYQH